MNASTELEIEEVALEATSPESALYGLLGLILGALQPYARRAWDSYCQSLVIGYESDGTPIIDTTFPIC